MEAVYLISLRRQSFVYHVERSELTLAYFQRDRLSSANSLQSLLARSRVSDSLSAVDLTLTGMNVLEKFELRQQLLILGDVEQDGSAPALLSDN